MRSRGAMRRFLAIYENAVFVLVLGVVIGYG